MEVNKSICDTAYAVFTNASLDFILFFVLILNLFAIILNVLVVFGIFDAKTIHIHLRILFIHLALVLLFRTCCTTFRASSMLFNSFLQNNSCEMIYSLVKCKAFSEISKSGLDIMMYCFIPISLERLIATLKFSTYEKSNHQIICIFCGILLPWCPNILEFAVTFTSMPVDEYIPYCSSLSSSAHDFDHLTRIQLPFCFFCVVVSVATVFLSYKKRNLINSRNASNGLSGQYQLKENIRTTKLIIPIVVAYSVTLSLHIFALVLVANSYYPTTAEFAVAKEWSSFMIPIFANFFPLAFLLGSDDVAKRCIPKIFYQFSRSPKRIVPLATGTDYFLQYDATWR